MGINEYIKQQYEEQLEKQYENFKKELNQPNFVPDPEEVWKMYSNTFYENTGICKFVMSLLDIEAFDEHGALNEYHKILDSTNKKLSDLCSTYVAAWKKGKEEN